MDILEKISIILDRMDELAKGWTRESVAKFGKTIGKAPDEHGFFDSCVLEMKKNDIKDAEGLCAEMKDVYYGSTKWRGKGKKKKDMPVPSPLKK